jgi:hypothetical protein|tara:strand:+ start:713 stop:2041 length:1329 start_codon:yes stop_codon:yes gene_type:complete
MSADSEVHKPSLLLVELNEFDPEFLSAKAEELGLANIKRALSLPRAITTTDDRIEHQGLDPWVQWVNVHCGKPLSEHGVRRIGQTKRQDSPQIWSVLGERGYTWGVWGAMNAPRQDAPGCQFFFPDPWAFEEEAYPKSLNKLLALPRYMARNYLDVDRAVFLREAMVFTAALVSPSMWKSTFTFSREMLGQILRGKLSVHTMSTFLDYLSTLVFVSNREKMKPDFSLIFLNNIAHLQHQFWRRGEKLHPEMELGLRLTDKMLGLLMDSMKPHEAMILLNGLKQRNVEGEGFCIYRQKNPQLFVERLGVTGTVEQGMTHDAHILCDSVEEADNAERILQECRMSNGEVLFDVERVSDTRVFYQIAFEREISPGLTIVSGNSSFDVDEILELYARRTGAHVPDADVFSKGIALPEKMHNHEIFHFIDRHFAPVAAKPVETAEFA